MRIKRHTLTLLILAFSVMQASAQLVGGTAFLQGCYIELAISECGVYGSVEPVPDTGPYGEYHANVFVGLGFVADHEEDGWGTHTGAGQPNFCGDYFTPGTPEEGWAIQHVSDVWANHMVPCEGYGDFVPADIEGEIVDYGELGGFKTATWEGEIDEDINVTVQQKTIFPDGALYFLTSVTLCNEGPDDITDLYYMRNVDPDQDQPNCGTFSTINTVVSQPPLTGDTAFVQSIGASCGCYLGMGAIDSRARVSYGLFFTDDATPEDSWNGTGGYFNTGTQTNDIGNQISFKVDIPAGECTEIKYAHVLDQNDLDEALAALAGAVGVFANGVDISATGTVALCAPGDTINLEIIGADEYTWTWSPDYAIDPTTGTSVFVYPDTSTTYTAVGTGAACGDVYRTVTIIIDTLEYANAGMDTAICLGDIAFLNGDGGAGDSLYVWEPSTYLDCDDCQNSEALPTEAGTYTYTLTTYDIYNCPATDDITVLVRPLPVVDAGDDVDLCPEGDVQLEATGAETYTWSPSAGLSCDDCPDPVCTVNDNTTYTVTGIDEFGCINTDDIDVSVFSTLDITVTATPPTIDSYLGETSQLLAEGAETYTWTPSVGLSATNIPNPIANPADTTTYYVTGIDENGCTDIDTITVNVIGELTIGVPNAFSPNGDGINDYWKPVYSGSGELENYLVFNRWGELVYEGTADSKGWDGKIDNEDQGIGTYTVVINAHTSLNEKRMVTGNFILVR